MRKLDTLSCKYRFDKKRWEEEEEVFSFVTFCFVYPQYWRLLNCFDFREIVFCFVLFCFEFLIWISLGVAHGWDEVVTKKTKKWGRSDVENLMWTIVTIQNIGSQIAERMMLLRSNNLFSNMIIGNASSGTVKVNLVIAPDS